MTWSINTNDLARISSFEQAEKHWAEVKEWKGQPSSYRPLAGRRKKHMLLNKLSQGGYECQLYGTAIVTYYPDNSVKLRTYDSTSTNLFAWDMRPGGCSPVSHKSQMYWKVETPEGPHYQRETMVVVPGCNPGSWNVTNPAEPEKEWVLDRKKAAEVRKIIKPYKTWLEMTDRLTGTTRRNYTGTYGYERSVQQLLDEPEHLAAYPTHRRELGPPSLFLRTAYEVYGARTKQPVPFNRLPRERA